jgi:hypothetical protein
MRKTFNSQQCQSTLFYLLGSVIGVIVSYFGQSILIFFGKKYSLVYKIWLKWMNAELRIRIRQNDTNPTGFGSQSTKLLMDYQI